MLQTAGNVNLWFHIKFSRGLGNYWIDPKSNGMGEGGDFACTTFLPLLLVCRNFFDIKLIFFWGGRDSPRAGYFFKSTCTVTNFSHSNPPITFLTTSRLYPTLQFIFLLSFGSVFGLLRNYMYSIHVHYILYKNPRS